MIVFIRKKVEKRKKFNFTFIMDFCVLNFFMSLFIRVAVFPAPVRYAGKGNGGEGSAGEGDGEDHGGGGAGTGAGFPGETRGIQNFFPSHKILKIFFFDSK